MGLEEWKRKNDQARIDRLIHQQEQENEKAIHHIEEQIVQIQKQEAINEKAAASIEEGFQSMIDDMISDFDGDYEKADYIMLKAEHKMFVGFLNLLDKMITPLTGKGKSIFDKLKNIIENCRLKMEADDKVRKEFINNTQNFKNFGR